MKTKHTVQTLVSEIHRRTFPPERTMPATVQAARTAWTFSRRAVTLASGIMLPLILLFVLPAPILGADGNPGVLPPEAKPLGVSYGDWFAHWWNWIISFPADENPLL